MSKRRDREEDIDLRIYTYLLFLLILQIALERRDSGGTFDKSQLPDENHRKTVTIEQTDEEMYAFFDARRFETGRHFSDNPDSVLDISNEKISRDTFMDEFCVRKIWLDAKDRLPIMTEEQCFYVQDKPSSRLYTMTYIYPYALKRMDEIYDRECERMGIPSDRSESRLEV